MEPDTGNALLDTAGRQSPDACDHYTAHRGSLPTSAVVRTISCEHIGDLVTAVNFARRHDLLIRVDQGEPHAHMVLQLIAAGASARTEADAPTAHDTAAPMADSAEVPPPPQTVTAPCASDSATARTVMQAASRATGSGSKRLLLSAAVTLAVSVLLAAGTAFQQLRAPRLTRIHELPGGFFLRYPEQWTAQASASGNVVELLPAMAPRPASIQLTDPPTSTPQLRVVVLAAGGLAGWAPRRILTTSASYMAPGVDGTSIRVRRGRTNVLGSRPWMTRLSGVDNYSEAALVVVDDSLIMVYANAPTSGQLRRLRPVLRGVLGSLQRISSEFRRPPSQADHSDG